MKTKVSRTIFKTGRSLFVVLVLCLSVYAFGCGGRGDTANNNDPNAGSGTPFVSDGGSGSTLKIEFEGSGNELGVTQQREFKVIATDPQGNPLSYIRVFCESERGIAILEPSSGGVAFESTSLNGIMSGVIGGLAPGSYLMECRGPQGFNLIARASLKITGEVPEGFAGFPGAAGGNLGGGFLFDPPTSDELVVVEVLFSTISNPEPSRVADVDLNQGVCVGPPPFPEPYGPDNFVMSVTNTFIERVTLLSVELEVPNGQGATFVTEQQLAGLVIPGQGSLENNSLQFIGALTEVGTGNGVKRWAGVGVDVPPGVHNVRFTLKLRTQTGRDITLSQFGLVRPFNLNACPI